MIYNDELTQIGQYSIKCKVAKYQYQDHLETLLWTLNRALIIGYLIRIGQHSIHYFQEKMSTLETS
jgi:hypothetical protein